MRIAIVAGEASGDLLGSQVVAGLRARLPQAEFFGVAGPNMIAAGVRALFSLDTLAVRGYVEALRKLPDILRLRRALKARLLAAPPDLYIGVDAPDFNLGLERALRRRGVRTVHVASPSIWAWRGGRIKTIRRAVDHMLVLFPFERAIYERAGVPVTYVGHPLADAIDLEPDTAAARERLRLTRRSPIIALLPGSRDSELELHADLFIATAQRLWQQFPQVHFLVPLASRTTWDLFEAALYRNQAQELPLKILFGHAQEALVAADVVLVKSGTATLETALCKKPMVITYRVPRLTAWLMVKRAHIRCVGLPNVLAGRFIVPELLQDEATPDNLAQAVGNLWRDRRLAQGLAGEFRILHEQLRQGMQARAAEAILPLLQEGRAHD